jgi:hypothetical protein
MHPPAIQSETVMANSKRILFAKNSLILLGSLLRVTKTHKASGNLLCLLWSTSVTVQLLA